MERSYGFPSNYFQNKYLLIAHLRELYYKGLDHIDSKVTELLWLNISCTKNSYVALKSDGVVTKFMAKY